MVKIGSETSKKQVFVEQPRLHRVSLPSYSVSHKKLAFRKTTIYTKIQKSAIKMTFATIIALKQTNHYNVSDFWVQKQKSPKITLYQINSVKKTLKLTKNLKCFEKRAKNERISIDLGGKRS